ncbi:HIT domain-containing protein [Acidipila sp. EB88]|uniref:HIT domain-containing protein n=1 Tax=Acidipila sp. EB88 TaxID=2305226 RepID=UPI000F5FEFE4|nr:HIT domain-containing protein [Acidipila sp. EB88]RRA48410.1 HIT domain-containing protein [Acidipila sp. EB88]
MEHLWTPWRYSYITGEKHEDHRKGVPPELRSWPGDLDCVFCNLLGSVDHAMGHGMAVDEAEQAALLVCRGERVFVCLNRFPYNSGHVMVVPYVHGASLAELPADTAADLMHWGQAAERALGATYHPDGYNLGLNLGAAAGAGVAGHLHLHAVPRWVGDTSFLSTLGETRTLPEPLTVTWKRLREAFAAERPLA